MWYVVMRIYASLLWVVMANRKKQKPMKRITVTVDPDDYEAFDQMAAHSEVTASWLIRRSMREFIERHRQNRVVELTLPPVKQAN